MTESRLKGREERASLDQQKMVDVTLAGCADLDQGISRISAKKRHIRATSWRRAKRSAAIAKLQGGEPVGVTDSCSLACVI